MTIGGNTLETLMNTEVHHQGEEKYPTRKYTPEHTQAQGIPKRGRKDENHQNYEEDQDCQEHEGYTTDQDDGQEDDGQDDYDNEYGLQDEGEDDGQDDYDEESQEHEPRDEGGDDYGEDYQDQD